MAAIFLTSPKTNDRLARLWEELRADPVPPEPVTKPGRTPVLLREAERWPGMAIDDPSPGIRTWRVDLAQWLQGLLEPALPELPPASHGEASPEMSMAAAHEAALALYNPFHWEPKPAWVNSAARPTLPFSNTVHPQHFAARPKIPLRPLHKRPFYKRFFFYLRRWLNRAA